jgi:hypothetical protein
VSVARPAAGIAKGSAAAMPRRTILSTLPAAAAALALRGAHAARPAAEAVDVLLVLAIDASGSLTDQRITLQREGHARAITNTRLLDAVRAGPLGRVALTVVEWSNQDRQTQTVPWAVISDAVAAGRFAQALMRAPGPIPGFTSISGAIDGAVRLIARAPYEATRRVIDISGNGVNNDGRPVVLARDDALAAGITINGLPILDVDPGLDEYFAAEVIGGPRAFTVIAHDIGSFAEAIQRKLITEIA